jgi:hypothetical protein
MSIRCQLLPSPILASHQRAFRSQMSRLAPTKSGKSAFSIVEAYRVFCDGNQVAVPASNEFRSACQKQSTSLLFSESLLDVDKSRSCSRILGRRDRQVCRRFRCDLPFQHHGRAQQVIRLYGLWTEL